MPINIINIYNIYIIYKLCVLRTTTVHETKSFPRTRKKRTGEDEVHCARKYVAGGRINRAE
jgi:hypothetical protein